jgi:hypothetical protein
MLDLRSTLAMLAPRVTAAWGPAAAFDLEMRVEPLAELAAAIERVGPAVFEAELASYLAGPRAKAVAIGLLIRLRRRPAAPVPIQEPGLDWGAPIQEPLPAEPVLERWPAEDAAADRRAAAEAVPIAEPVELAPEREVTAFIPTVRPRQELTRYHERLLALLAPCADPSAVQ